MCFFLSGDESDGRIVSPLAETAPKNHQSQFTVSAQDGDGGSATKSAGYTVTTSRLQAPIISSASQTSRRWREGGTLPHLSATQNRRPVGTTFAFVLSQPATVALTFTRETAGRSVHGACVRSSAKTRRGRRCTTRTVIGTLSFNGARGPNKIRFAGRISATDKLNPGTYALGIAATNSQGQRSAPRSLTFTIVT